MRLQITWTKVSYLGWRWNDLSSSTSASMRTLPSPKTLIWTSLEFVCLNSECCHSPNMKSNVPILALQHGFQSIRSRWRTRAIDCSTLPHWLAHRQTSTTIDQQLKHLPHSGSWTLTTHGARSKSVHLIDCATFAPCLLMNGEKSNITKNAMPGVIFTYP